MIVQLYRLIVYSINSYSLLTEQVCLCREVRPLVTRGAETVQHCQRLLLMTTLWTQQKYFIEQNIYTTSLLLPLPDSGAAPPRSHSQVTLRSRRPLPQVTEHWKYFWIRPELFLLVHEISQKYFKGFEHAPDTIYCEEISVSARR